MPYAALHDRARRLRQDATLTERCLWQVLRSRSLGAKFRRQHPIPPYIADFACPELRLAVEIDGGHHGPERDAARDAALAAAGWHVLRYWNNDVRDKLEGVLDDIRRVLAERRRQR